MSFIKYILAQKDYKLVAHGSRLILHQSVELSGFDFTDQETSYKNSYFGAFFHEMSRTDKNPAHFGRFPHTD